MLEAPLIFRKENVMAKQVFVDFELPEAMLADTNKIIKENLSNLLRYRFLVGGTVKLKTVESTSHYRRERN